VNQVQWFIVSSRPSRPSGSTAGRWAFYQEVDMVDKKITNKGQSYRIVRKKYYNLFKIANLLILALFAFILIIRILINPYNLQLRIIGLFIPLLILSLITIYLFSIDKCPNCKTHLSLFTIPIRIFNYCPVCGVSMDTKYDD
jgi:hypothetical protein